MCVVIGIAGSSVAKFVISSQKLVPTECLNVKEASAAKHWVRKSGILSISLLTRPGKSAKKGWVSEEKSWSV